MRRWSFAASVCFVVLGSMSVAGVAGGIHASADATTTACTPDNNPAFGPSLDALDPCRADTGSPSDDNADYSYGTAIVSHFEVPVPVTTVDALGTAPGPSPEYVWVDYIRPKISDTLRVPTVMDASPYYNTLGRGYDGILKTPTDPNAPEPVNVERCGGATVCTNYANFPEWMAHYFVPRGYAVLLMDLRGTRNSSGCEIYGDKQEALDAVAVIDWIASQSWSNQRVGMLGGSYDGTIANGAAALYPSFGQHHNVDGHGTDALAAVIPIRAIDRWYDYQFFNGVEANGQELDPELFTAELPTEDNPTNGPDIPPGDASYVPNLAQRHGCPLISQIPADAGYTAPYQDTKDAGTTNFWNSRDFLQYASTWKAATLFIHGLYDNNVKTMNSGQLWDALNSRQNPPPLRYLWFNGAHADPDTPTVAQETPNDYFEPFVWMQKYEHEAHQWFLQYLKGVDAGATQAPKAEIQRDYDDPGDTLQQGHWDAYSQWPAPGSDSVLHFNAVSHTADAAPAPSGSVQWDDTELGTSGAAASQSFTTAPFATDTRVSGQFEFDLNIAAQGTDTSVTVEIDDVPPAASGFSDLDFNRASSTKAFAITYGYLLAFYRDSVNGRGASYPSNGSPLTPNTHYAVHFPSMFTDYVVPAGHRLRFTFADVANDPRSGQGSLSMASGQGNVVTMFSGLGDGTSQVRIPIASAEQPQAQVPEFSGLLASGPAAAGLVGLAAWAGVRRRRRQRA